MKLSPESARLCVSCKQRPVMQPRRNSPVLARDFTNAMILCEQCKVDEDDALVAQCDQQLPWQRDLFNHNGDAQEREQTLSGWLNRRRA